MIAVSAVTMQGNKEEVIRWDLQENATGRFIASFIAPSCRLGRTENIAIILEIYTLY